MSDNFLTIKQTADKLQVHYQTIRNMIKTGRIEYTKVGKNIRIKESSIESTKIKKDINVHEIEIRFFTKNRSKVEMNLLKAGAKVIDHSHIIDHWYIPKHIKSMLEKNEWYDTAKGFGLRIRELDISYSGKIMTSIEVKKLFIPYKHDTCIEREIDVRNFEEADNLLNLMDFKNFLTIDKDRIAYAYKDLKVEIDDIKDYGTAISIEWKTNKKREIVVPLIKKFAQKIGLNLTKELTEKSVTYDVMEKFAKF